MAVYGQTSVEVRKLNHSWTESTATYNNAIGYIDGETIATKTLTTSQGRDYENPHLGVIDITNATEDHYDAGKAFYGVAIKWRSGGHIIINSREVSSSDAAYVLVNYETLDIESGAYYYIQNKDTKTYLQIDDADKNSTPSYSTWGAAIETHGLAPDAGNYQKWKIEYYGDGYFTVTSKQSNMYLTVRAGDINAGGNPLAQLSDPITEKSYGE